MRMIKLVVAVVIAIFVGTPVFAQEKSWGVSFDATPQWEYMSIMDRFIGSNHRLEGQEVRVGVVRGRIHGGDWGVSFVRGEVNSSSFSSERTGALRLCQGPASALVCTTRSTDVEHYVGNASTTGFEVHKYLPFATIAERVQVGINFGGGVMWASGSVDKHTIETLAVSQRTVETRTIPYREDEVVSRSRTVETVPFKDVSGDVLGFATIPTGRIEAVVGVVVTDHLKVKMGGGLNFPTQHRITIGAVYMF